MNSRDRGASLKMHGALLRLDALSPGGFTWRDLAEHADVSSETARDFFKPDRRPDFLEKVEVPAPREKSNSGPPTTIFRVSDAGREKLVKLVGALRRQLDNDEGLVPTPEDLFASLELFEETVEQLGAGREGVEDWDELLQEAELEYRGCRAEQRALFRERGPFAVKYATRLYTARTRLRWVKNGETPYKLFDPFDAVRTFGGEWLTPQPRGVEPAVVLFDGTGTSQAITSRLVTACNLKRFRVASFPVAEMNDAERTKMYSCLGYMRVATPLVGCGFVLAVDGETKLAPRLAAEFRAFAYPVQWNEKGQGRGLIDLDVDFLRSNYIRGLAPMVQQRERTFARYCLSALTTFSALHASIESAEDVDLLLGEGRAGWLDTARQLMGRVVCLDSSNNQALKQSFSGGVVNYVGGVGASGAMNLSEIFGRHEIYEDLRMNG
jgi:hypothetical protein